MKNSLSILVLLVGLFSDVLAQKYMFVGFYQNKSTDRYFCQDWMVERQTVNTMEEYNLVRGTFIKKYNNESRGTKFAPLTKAFLVFEYQAYRAEYKCNYKAMGIVIAPTLDSAAKSLEKLVAANPKTYHSKPIIVYKWPGTKTSAAVKEVNYYGLLVSYSIVENSSGKQLMVIKGKNTSTINEMSYSFIANNKVQFEDTLPPGTSFSRTIPAGNFNIEVKQREYKPLSKGLIDWFKEVVRDEITIKGGKIEKASSFTGVRG